MKILTIAREFNSQRHVIWSLNTTIYLSGVVFVGACLRKAGAFVGVLVPRFRLFVPVGLYGGATRTSLVLIGAHSGYVVAL